MFDDEKKFQISGQLQNTNSDGVLLLRKLAVFTDLSDYWKHGR